jgi:hypothetical protein
VLAFCPEILKKRYHLEDVIVLEMTLNLVCVCVRVCVGIDWINWLELVNSAVTLRVT